MSDAPRAVEPKWRPTLAMITFATLAAVLAAPLAGLLFFRLYETQLVRQTEGELIAQSTALAAVLAREVAAEGGLALGPPRPPRSPTFADSPLTPIEPGLNLAAGRILPPREDALPTETPLDPAWTAVGGRMGPIIEETRRTTLAGFRILNTDGVVVAGGDEVGLSLAHVEEVQTALTGRYDAALRVRIPELPHPPIYSVSRGAQIRVFVAMPAFVDGRLAGVVYASRTPDNILRQLYRVQGEVFMAGLLTLFLAGGVGWVFVRTLNRPIHLLIDLTAAIARGEREAIRPLDQHGTRELAKLTESFLAMARKLSDRSDYIATFAAHVSHELKAPLTSIRGAAELLADSGSAMTPAERERFLGNIVADAGRLTLLVERLRDLARAENPDTHGACTLAELANAMTARFPTLAIAAEGELDRAFAMSAENARIVFANLLDNARSHGAKAVTLSARTEPGVLIATVSDDGEGVSEANREKIFDLFFTTRRENGGTGMGLVIVSALLRAHGGAITLLRPEEGAAFEVRVPLAGV